MLRSSFRSNLEQLSCRRIIEENHTNPIIALLEEKCHDGICRYVASISKQQVNIYDNDDGNSNLGFFAHYIVEQTPYFRGGNCTCGYWLYPQSDRPMDSVLAVGTDEGEVFLLSCVDCYIISILTSPSQSPIVSISSSPSYRNLVLVLNQSRSLTIYDRLSSSVVFQYDSNKVRNVFCDADVAILELFSGEFVVLNLNTFTLYTEIKIEPIQGVFGCVSLYSKSQWILFTHKRWYALDQKTFRVSAVCDVSLPSYIDQSRVALSFDEGLIAIAEHSFVRIFLTTGEEIGSLVDNYAAGVQLAKESTTYHKLPIAGCMIHPQGKYAVMTEANRVMRFDVIDPNARYVAHVKYPHPVEDMFIFYSSLNADPVIYLSPKVSTESKNH